MISKLIAFLAMIVAVFADQHLLFEDDEKMEGQDGNTMLFEDDDKMEGGAHTNTDWSPISGCASYQQSMMWITVAASMAMCLVRYLRN